VDVFFPFERIRSSDHALLTVPPLADTGRVLSPFARPSVFPPRLLRIPSFLSFSAHISLLFKIPAYPILPHDFHRYMSAFFAENWSQHPLLFVTQSFSLSPSRICPWSEICPLALTFVKACPAASSKSSSFPTPVPTRSFLSLPPDHSCRPQTPRLRTSVRVVILCSPLTYGRFFYTDISPPSPLSQKPCRESFFASLLLTLAT